MAIQPDTADERALVVRTLEGDDDAFAALVRAHQGVVYNIAYRLVGHRESALDLAQETFLRAFKALRTFDVERPFGPWLYRIATNLSINHVKRARLPTISLDAPAVPGAMDAEPLAIPDTRAEPASRFARAESQAQLRKTILSLPPNYRAVIEMRHFQDKSCDEIAKELNVSLGTVKTRIFRARRMLRDRLSGLLDG